MKGLSERSLLLLLAAVQFTHIMDFMIMMPLGPQLMRDLQIGPGYFSAFVAIYTVTSGVVGLLAAPFIDRFDRRKLLLLVYAGFGVATLACALAQTASTLLVARAVSGAFGGLSTSTIMAILGDVVPAKRRAGAVGIVMTAFSVAAALGVPFGLKLAQYFQWEAPFFMLAGLAGLTWLVAFIGLPAVRGHLENSQSNPARAFGELLRDANAGRALLFMAATVFGHFTIIPLMSPYFVGNMALPERDLFLVYFTGGILSVFTAPLIGKLADSLGRFRVFSTLTVVACVVTLAISHAGRLPVWAVLVLGGSFFVFASGRFVPGQAIMTLAVPASRRGAFMSLSGCARDIAMGVTSSIGGWVVTKEPSGQLVNFHLLGWIAVAASVLSVWLGSRVAINDVAAPMSTETSPSALPIVASGPPLNPQLSTERERA
jgi:MFS transporter, DHA1 family, inner membrane transport protein